MSAKQKQARLDAARAREEAAAAKKARTELLKKVGIIIVCIILALALFLPTVSLSFCSQQSADTTTTAQTL